MDFLNIHTHHQLREGEATVPSFGLHPWHLADDWRSQLAQIEEKLAATSSLVGECGLDHLCTTPYARQLEAFEAQVALSERYGRPLILHCVRAVDDVLRFKGGTKQTWVFHGFRGKPQQMQQLLAHGISVSFGFRHNEESVSLCPADRFFLETDDAPQPIVPLYEAVARRRNISVEELLRKQWENLRSLMCALSRPDPSLRSAEV